jgi:hypothetical protein
MGLRAQMHILRARDLFQIAKERDRLALVAVGRGSNQQFRESVFVATCTLAQLAAKD